MTTQERALLNADTMHDDHDRTFCGVELAPVTVCARRYIERMLFRYNQIGATPKEIAFSYAFLLTHTLPEMRRLSRSLDDFEIAMDKWLLTLPDPLPASELTQLEAIVETDMRVLEAAAIEIKPKPGQATAEAGAPPNS